MMITQKGVFVSLFTREWIEIAIFRGTFRNLCRLPLYEGVDWNRAVKVCPVKFLWVSLFTREWIEMLFYNVSAYNYHVSLFTREWIEIVSFASITAIKTVSLFTREWIEITDIANIMKLVESPSLRGSGLK